MPELGKENQKSKASEAYPATGMRKAGKLAHVRRGHQGTSTEISNRIVTFAAMQASHFPAAQVPTNYLRCVHKC